MYPARGQSEDQAARDRYECHLWAVNESGFDASAETEGESPVVLVYPDRSWPSGAGPIVGALGGAAAGAAIGAIAGDAAKGAAIGAVSGAVVGVVEEANEEERVRQELHDRAAAAAHRQAQRERLRSDYTRALSACLEARGYSVQ